ncbi:unnamed protein product [Schistosoma rodhaini]|uniref:PKD domain-containing protein n=1 Tax=Schistosoma rodhaini TaxID=6188 RepID=A0AA85EIJ2_9TREM|nr:unnamed protein product [Schistosoma rodhaini]
MNIPGGINTVLWLYRIIITTTELTVRQVGDKISINFVIPTEFKNLPGVKVYEFDYGDTIQTTENISDITIPLVISYNSPGPVWPTLRARNEDGTIVSAFNYNRKCSQMYSDSAGTKYNDTGSASLALMIYELITPADITFNCPIIVMGRSVFTCQLNCNKGSHIQGTVSFANDWQDAISLPEPNYDWIGLPPKRTTDTFISYNTNKLIITGSQARYDGTISTIQIHALLLTDVTFYLLRVQCTSGMYNFETNGCSLTNNRSVTCTANQVFSGLLRDCVNISSSDCGSLRQLKLDKPITVENYNYQVIGIYTVKLTVLGWQSIKLPSVWTIQSGDRIGFTSILAGSIGCAPSTSYEADDLETLTTFSGTNGSSVLGSGLKRLTLIRHQIGAWIRPTHGALLTGYINTTGYKDVSLQLYSYWGKNYTSPALIKTPILIDEIINETQLILNICDTDTQCPLELKNHTGINVTYVWDFGDGTVQETTSVKTVQHIYTAVGIYNLTVNISNSIQYKIITQNITVLKKTEFNGIQGNYFAELNELTTIKLNITGKRFICSWYINGILTKNDNMTQFDYKHIQNGVVVWNVTCQTPAIAVSKKLEQFVLERFTGLSLVTKSLQVAKPTQIVFTFITGNNLTAQLIFFNQVLNTSIDYVQKTITSELVSEPQTASVNYSLWITNPLGSNLTTGQIQFDVPVLGMNVQVQPNYVGLSENLIFRVSFQEGTSIILTVDYGDGEVIQQSAMQLQTWPSDYQLTKKYLNTGEYIVTFSASSGGNRENRTVSVYVVETIGVYTAQANTEYVAANNPVTLKITRLSGNPAVLTKISLDWGDNSQFTLDDFHEGNVYNHIYKSEGDFRVTTSLTNPVDQNVFVTTLKVRAGIENFGCQVVPNPVETGKLSVISVVYKSAKNVNITALLNNRTDPKQFNVPAPKLTEINYNYPVAGLYYEEIQAMNSVSNQSCSLIVDVRNKIVNVDIAYGGHAVYPSGSVTFTLTYTGLAANFPTLAKYEVVWGDGSAPSEGMLRLANQPEKISHVLADLNYFQASVTLDNVISNMTKNTQIAAFGLFQQIDLMVTVASTGYPGYGIDGNSFPLGVQLRFQVLADGKPNNVANITYSIINKTNNVILDSGTVWSNYFFYTFTKFGEYNVVVLASNPVSMKSISKELSIRTSIRGLKAYLVGNGMLEPNQQGIIQISFEAYPNDACLCVTKSDGIGSVYYPKLADPTSFCSLCPSYSRLQDVPVNLTFSLSVQYGSSGFHYVFIQAISESQMVDTKLYIPVTFSTCPPPKISMSNVSSQLTNYPIKAVTSEKINIEAILTVPDCLLSVPNEKLWTLYSIDLDTTQTLGPISLSQQLSSKTLRLGLPSNFLTPGTYKATCSVQFTPPQGVPYIVSESAYIIVVPPPLLVQFDVGNPISKTIDLSVNEICLKPEVYSLDPAMNNVNVPQGIGSWIWYCRQVDEQLSGKLILPKPPGFQYNSNYTGCFGDGPGVIDTNNGTLCFTTENFRVNKSYEFTVIGSKPPKRSGKATMRLLTTSEVTSIFTIRCSIPYLCYNLEFDSSNLTSWFIPESDDLYVTAFIEFGTLSPDMRFKWNIREMYSDGTLLPFDQVQQDTYTEGTFTSSYRVKKGYFINKSNNVRGCIVCATLTKNTDIGTSCLRFKYLPRPTPGICTYTLTDTYMCVSCVNFTSIVSPLTYTFFLKNSSINIVLASGNLPQTCFVVPYMYSPLDACVYVFDKFGGSIEVCYANVFVQAKSLDLVRAAIQSLLYEKGTELKRLIITGQLTESADLVTSYASVVQMFATLDIQNSTGVNNISDATLNRNSRSLVIQMLVNAVNNFIPTDSNSFILAMSSTESILDNTLDVDRSSQSKLNAYFTKVTESLEAIVCDNTNQLLKMTSTIFQSTLLLAEAGNRQINNPISLDIPTDPATLDYNVDLEKAGLQTSGLDPMADLMLQNSADQQSLLVGETLDMIRKLMTTSQKVTQRLLIEGAPPITFETSNGVISFSKITPNNLSNRIPVLDKLENGVFVNSLCDNIQALNKSCSEPYSLQTFISKTNLFSFRTGSSIPIPFHTETISLILYDSKPVTIRNVKEIVEGIVHRLSNFNPPIFTSMDPGTNRPQLPAPRISVDKTEVYQALLMSQQVVPNDVAVFFQLYPENISECPQYLLFLRLIDPPVISLSNGVYDMWTTLPEDTSQCVNMTTNPNDPNYRYTFILDNRQLMELRSTQKYRERFELLQKSVAQTVYIGFRQLNQYEINMYKSTSPPLIPYPYRDQINNTALSRWFLTSCVSGQVDSSKKWSTNKCRVGPETTVQQTQCICDELSTFTSGWFALPNSIDFNYVFANIDFNRNPTLYATEISLCIIFLLILIWARREDIKDIEKLSVTQLSENNPDCEYLYEIIVSTGHRRCAGTDSKVCFILSGQYGETRCYVLQDPNRKVLCRGATDRFLLACPKPLGPLIYIRLWHDNSGVGDNASWYCNYVGVVDLQTREKSHFIVESWFAVEESDGQVDRIIPVTSQEEMLTFMHMFSTTASRNMTDDHLWISVVARPIYSRFTRVERVACCLLLLYLSMLGSCMFYKGEGSAKQPDLISLGPFGFTPSEFYIAIVNNLLTFIPLFLIIYIFRNARLRVSHATKLRRAIEEHLDEKLYLGKASFIYSAQSAIKDTSKDDDPEALADNADDTKAKQKGRTLFCGWQMRILAWLLLILCLGIAVVFTTFYGVMFGEATCKKWLSSLFLSFFISVLLAQPIKVLLLAVFFSFVCKSTDRVDQIEIFEEEDRLIRTLGKRYQLRMDEEYLNNNYLSDDFRPQRLAILPPDPSDLARARAYRLKQRRANDIIREVILYVFFLTLLLIVSLDFRDSNGFLLKSSLQNLFFPDSFQSMNDVDDFYKWAQKVLIPGLRADRWYNRNPPLFQRGFLQDRTDRIIGYGMMRQLRTKKDSCNVHELAKHLFKHCYGSYDMFNEDKEAYGISWAKFEGDDKSNNSAPEFVYQNSSQLKGYPYLGQIAWYSGGGYVHLLRGSKDEMLDRISYLNQTHWIEFSTRAIIIQFTVYNPNINLFAIITALVEMPGIGAMIPSYRIETANLFGVLGSETKAAQITSQALFAFILFCYLIKEIRNMFRERLKYFTRFWNFVELFIICGSIAAIAAYIYMILCTKSSIEEFSRTHGNIYMNFQLLAYWNENLTYLTAIICFFAMLKLVYLFRFNQRVGLLGSVLKYAATDLKYFCFIFLVVFSAFVLVFYLLYNDTLSGFKTILNAIETSMQIILGKFDFTSMYERQMVLGPLLFAAFSLCVVFVMVSMFIAILDESFQHVLKDLSLQSDDHEMTQFILIQFIQCIGLDKTAWGKNFIRNVNTQQQEPIYDPESESSKHVVQLKSLMNEFLEHIQQNLITEEKKSVDSQ